MNKLVGIEEVAEHFSVSKSTFRKWLRTGVIPKNLYMNVGRTMRFDLERIQEALMSCDKSDDL